MQNPNTRLLLECARGKKKETVAGENKQRGKEMTSERGSEIKVPCGRL